MLQYFSNTGLKIYHRLSTRSPSLHQYCDESLEYFQSTKYYSISDTSYLSVPSRCERSLRTRLHKRTQ